MTSHKMTPNHSPGPSPNTGSGQSRMPVECLVIGSGRLSFRR